MSDDFESPDRYREDRSRPRNVLGNMIGIMMIWDGSAEVAPEDFAAFIVVPQIIR